tara:strand:- start:606 stop:824 length:219 start_codon:yes stop_codon:yes gene_type:complete
MQMVQVVVDQVGAGVLWELIIQPELEETEVFTVVVLVQGAVPIKWPVVGSEEMEQFVLYGVRDVRFLRTQLN